MKAITLVKTRKGCAICEKEDRYHIYFFGKFWDELYFNTRGYVGYLPAPLPDGSVIRVNMGECGISAYKKEVANLNKEWATINCTKV